MTTRKSLTIGRALLLGALVALALAALFNDSYGTALALIVIALGLCAAALAVHRAEQKKASHVVDDLLNRLDQLN